MDDTDLQQQQLLTSEKLYVTHYRTSFDKLVAQGLVVGIVTVLFQIITLTVTWNNRTAWLRQIPCTFQEPLEDFAQLTKLSNFLIEFGTMAPGIGFIAYAFFYLQPKNRNASDDAWKPMRTSFLSMLYSAKVLVPILVYTSINFKLPVFVKYKMMASKACGVTGSLVLYPPGRDGAVVNETYVLLRRAYSVYLSNQDNLIYPEFAQWEQHLMRLENDTVGADMDDNPKCEELGVLDTNGSLSVLTRYSLPPPSIDQFCSEGYEMARNIGKSKADALEFSLDVMAQHFTNLFAAIPVTYYGCTRDVSNALRDQPSPNKEINFEELCKVFHSTDDYASIPEEYAPFISQEQFTKYSKGIAALELESERQIGCLFAADLVDPKNGFDAAATFLCPSLTSTLESSQSFLEKYDCKTGSEWKKSIWYPPKDEKEWIIFGSKKDSPSSYLTVMRERYTRVTPMKLDWKNLNGLYKMIEQLKLDPEYTTLEPKFLIDLTAIPPSMQEVYKTYNDYTSLMFASMDAAYRNLPDPLFKKYGKFLQDNTASANLTTPLSFRFCALEVDIVKDRDPLEESIQSLGTNPFTDAKTNGYYNFIDKRSVAVWPDFARLITNTMYLLFDAGVIDHNQKEETTRWTMQDARSIAALGSKQATAAIEKLTMSTEGLKVSVVGKLREDVDAYSKLWENSTEEGLAKVKKVFEEDILLNKKMKEDEEKDVESILLLADTQLYYDMKYDVIADWNMEGGLNESVHELLPNCGPYGPDKTFTKEECEYRNYSLITNFPLSTIDVMPEEQVKSYIRSCVWREKSSKCGKTPNYASDPPHAYAIKKGKSKSLFNNRAVAELSKYGTKQNSFTKTRNELSRTSATQPPSKLELVDNIDAFIDEELTKNVKQQTQLAYDLKVTSIIGMLKTSQLISNRIFQATNTAIRLVRYVIGTFVGFSVISKLLPFAIAIVAGVNKGVKGFSSITKGSNAFTVAGDQTSLKRFNSLLLFVTGLVVSIPLITILIFFYQSFGEAYFVLVVVAMEIWSIASAFKGFMTVMQNNLVTLLSTSLALAGFFCWVFLDESAMLIANYVVEQGNELLWEQTFLKIFTSITSIVFSYFFSKVITVQIISRLSAMTFAHGVSGKVVYEEVDEDGTTKRTQSSLWVLDIWREGSRRQTLIKSTNIVPAAAHSEDVGTVAADTRNKDLAADMRNWGKGRG